MAGPLAVLCGQLLVVGIAGRELSTSERGALERGERGGIVLFKRNIPDEDGPAVVLALNRAIHQACPKPPIVAIDQEGGRVMRMCPPALALPAMRLVGDLGDVDFAARLAEAQARELLALGF